MECEREKGKFKTQVYLSGILKIYVLGSLLSNDSKDPSLKGQLATAISFAITSLDSPFLSLEVVSVLS